MSSSPSSPFKAQNRRKIVEITKKLEKEKKSKMYYIRRCEILETIINDNCPNLLPPKGMTAQEVFFDGYQNYTVDETNETETNEKILDSLQNTLILEMQNNKRKNIHGRRWSDTAIMVSAILFFLGPKCYDYIRKIFTLPNPKTIKRHFKPAINNWKLSLVNLIYICDILQLFRRKYDLAPDREIDIVLGVDALSMDIFKSKDDECDSAFMFLIMPLSCEYKPISIHLLPDCNGKAGKDILDKLDTIIKILKEQHFNILYIATDGDSGYQSKHNAFYQKWFNILQTKGLDEAMCSVLNEKEWPVTDFLHILKNARSRIMNGNVSLRIDGLYPTNNIKMNIILQLGKSLQDRSTLGKMKDIYPLEIFTLNNFLKCIEQDAYVEAFYILPYALWCEAIRNPVISPQMRLEILSMILNIFSFFLENIHSLGNGVSQVNSKGSVQFFSSEI